MSDISQQMIDEFNAGRFIGDKASQYFELKERFGDPGRAIPFSNPKMIFDVAGRYAVMVGRKSFWLIVKDRLTGEVE